MHTSPETPEPENADETLGAIISERRQLINLAYRLLGSLADAEDVVQEAYTRWYAMTPAQREAVTTPGAWLTTVASRICLDLLGSARVRRESYVGEWLPEPLPDHAEWADGGGSRRPVDPADRVTLDESVNMALLVVLDAMTPAERVAFVLHDVFRYSFNEVAEIVGRSPAACRQLASSARRRVDASRAKVAPATQQAALVRQFKQAWEEKDIATLINLLDPNAMGLADGGGVVNAAPPTGGSERIARYLVAMLDLVPDLKLLERTVNGRPGLVVQQEGVTSTVIAFDVADDRITRFWAMRNPEKLRPWTEA
ncbi:RNA polymerase sigma factor [Streptomyces spiroverticillatus]|uniref:RNA polymerase sigma factor n=1 Tax=Streptomyces finlayi TaxID=67296 RepID=A0A918X2A4_9ACTN|nr:RNA polymerase sigma factor SigJ [Streptomyces finlayi]GHA23645.1 RNA polymerase sigma factor [Streptomyces spiroverticillatus]GHD04872.1 RNA polymerase sigma factor [Streptomyces finlayi]